MKHIISIKGILGVLGSVIIALSIPIMGYCEEYTIDEYYNHLLQEGESCFIDGENYYTKVGDKQFNKGNIAEFVDKIRLAKYTEFIKAQGTAENPFPKMDIAKEKYTGGILEGESIYDESISLTSLSRKSDISRYTITLKGGIEVKVVIPTDAYLQTYTNAEGETKTRWASKGSAGRDEELSEREKQEYKWDSKVCRATEKGMTGYVNAVKDGFIAGSVETGFNVGSIYSDTQKALDDVMTEIGEGSTTQTEKVETETTTEEESTDSTEESSENTEEAEETEGSELSGEAVSGPAEEEGKDSIGGLYKFKDSISLKASMDYFYSPLFGKIDVTQGIPKTAAEWSKPEWYEKVKIEKGVVQIDEGYKNFVNPDSTLRLGLYEVDPNLVFKNGVKKYTKGKKIVTNSKEPKKLVDYTMRVATPYKYVAKGINNAYTLEEGGLGVIEGIRMSLYNDTIYKEVEMEEEGEKRIERVKVCTNNDIELDRKYITIFKQMINGSPVGVVVVLKYSEAVVDTTGTGVVEGDAEGFSKRVYYTGRNIIFGNNYSSNMVIDEINKEVLGYTTRRTGITGIKGINFTFPSEGKTTEEYITRRESHKDMKGSEGFTYLMTFVGNGVTEEETEEGKGLRYGFLIFRNNQYVNDSELLSWLNTKEAMGMSYVRAEELRKLITGEFGVADITFTEWLEMQRIRGELQAKEESIPYNIINVALILLGSISMLLGITLPIMGVWDVVSSPMLNVSLIERLSKGRLYPIMTKGDEDLVGLGGGIRCVTIFELCLMGIGFIFLGYCFMKTTDIVTFIINIFNYYMTMLG